MGKALATRILSALAVGLVLAQLSPVATGMSLCIGEEAAADCCPGPQASPSRAEEAVQLRGGDDCDCCITVDAAPSTAGTTAHKASVEFVPGSDFLRTAISHATTRLAGPSSHGPGTPRLSSFLSTVVLLI